MTALEPYYYLLLDLMVLSIPLWRSFDQRAPYRKQWKGLFIGIAVAGSFFIVWDSIFEHLGVWGFNDRYLLGPRILGLPIEEWTFFIVVPYACVFIYHSLNFFFPPKPNRKLDLFFGVTQIAVLGGLALYHHDKAYTFWNFGLFTLFLIYLVFYKRPTWLSAFWRAYGLALIGFFLMNGVLTGFGLEEPIVWYNPDEFMGIRMVTIPVEDTFYGEFLVLWVVLFYEKYKK